MDCLEFVGALVKLGAISLQGNKMGFFLCADFMKIGKVFFVIEVCVKHIFQAFILHRSSTCTGTLWPFEKKGSEGLAGAQKLLRPPIIA